MSNMTKGATWDSKGDPKTEGLTAGVAGTYLQGSIVVYLAAGKITRVPASGLKRAGIVAETTVISSDDVTNGKKVRVHTGGWHRLPTASAAATDEGELVYINAGAPSDNPADLRAQGAGSTGDQAFGRVKLNDGTYNWVDIEDVAAPATHS